MIGIHAEKEREAAFIEASESSSEKWEGLVSDMQSDGQRAILVHIREECKPKPGSSRNPETYVMHEAVCIRKKTREILAHAHASQSDPEVTQEMADRVSRDFPTHP